MRANGFVATPCNQCHAAVGARSRTTRARRTESQNGYGEAQKHKHPHLLKRRHEQEQLTIDSFCWSLEHVMPIPQNNAHNLHRSSTFDGVRGVSH